MINYIFYTESKYHYNSVVTGNGNSPVSDTLMVIMYQKQVTVYSFIFISYYLKKKDKKKKCDPREVNLMSDNKCFRWFYISLM